MNNIKDKMNEHPNSVGKTYFEHMYDSLYYASYTFGVGVIFAVHAFCPFLFEHTGSYMISKLNNVLEERHQTIEEQNQTIEDKSQTQEQTHAEEPINKSCVYVDDRVCYVKSGADVCFHD